MTHIIYIYIYIGRAYIAGTPFVRASTDYPFTPTLLFFWGCSDHYPEPYLVAAPGIVANVANCSACKGAVPAPAYQLDPAQGCGATRCFPIGESKAAYSSANAAMGNGKVVGLNLEFAGQ